MFGKRPLLIVEDPRVGLLGQNGQGLIVIAPREQDLNELRRTARGPARR